MKPNLSDEQLHHKLNEELMKKASQLAEGKGSLKERLQKLESNRKGVSEAVYKRVHSDYLSKLEAADRKFQEFRKELDQELVTLTEKKLLIDEGLTYHREQIEEAKLRHSLGELSEEEYHRTTNNETTEAKRLEAALKKITDDLERLESLFGGEKESAPAKPEGVSETMTHTGEISTDVKLEKKSSSGKIILGEKTITPELLIMEEGNVTHTIPLDKDLHIGRSPSNDIEIKETKVSRRHAEIRLLSGKYVLVDLDSSNGTFVGGKKIKEHALKANDEIRVGKTILIFKT